MTWLREQWDRWEGRFVTRGQLIRAFNMLSERLDELSATSGETQAQVDADTAAIAQVGTDLTASVSTIQAELDALKNAAPASLDFTKLEAAIAPLDAQAKAVANLVPQAPAPPPPAPAGP